MASINNFIFHSHYPQEKIVWAYEGVVDNTNPYWNPDWDYGIFVPIPASIKAENLLLDGVWSSDGWKTTYPLNGTSRVYGWYQDEYSWYQDFDKVDGSVVLDFYYIDYPSAYIEADTVRGRKAEVRLWAYLVSSDNQSSVNWKTSEQLNHTLQKTTSLAQMNLVSENILTIPDGETRVIAHNLNFVPFCKIWSRNARGGWHKLNTAVSIVNGEPENNEIVKITDKTVSIKAFDPYGMGEEREFVVRIYGYAISQ